MNPDGAMTYEEKNYDNTFLEVVAAYASLGYPHELLGQWTLPRADVDALLEKVAELDPSNILEVGTFVGLTSLLLARHTSDKAHIHTIDPNLPLRTELESMNSSHHGYDVDVEAQELGRKVAARLGVADKITFHAGGFSVGATFATRNVDPSLVVPIVGPRVCEQHGPFDFAFVDGLHYHDVVRSDLDLVSQHLTPGGMIVLHDVAGMWGSNVRAAVFAFLTDHPQFVFRHPPLADCYSSIGFLQHVPVGRPRSISGSAPAPEFLSDDSRLSHLASILVNSLEPETAIVLGEESAALADKLRERGVTIKTGADERCDLCVCLGAADEASYEQAEQFIETCTELSDTVVFGCTPPGEFGAARPNARPIADWVRRFFARGYVFHDVIRPLFEPMTFANLPKSVFHVTNTDMLNIYLVRKDVAPDGDIPREVMLHFAEEKEAGTEQLVVQRLFDSLVIRGALDRESGIREQVDRQVEIARRGDEVNAEISAENERLRAGIHLLESDRKQFETGLNCRIAELNQRLEGLEAQKRQLEITVAHLSAPLRVRIAGALGREFPRLAGFVKRILGSGKRQETTIHPYFAGRTESEAQLRTEVDFAIDAGLEYARNVAASLGRATDPVPAVRGLRILEIGPGLNFGCMLVCRCVGAAEVAVLDKYLVEWNPDYHPDFYRLLAERARSRIPDGDFADLDAVVAGRERIRDVVRCEIADLGSERTSFADGHFDAIVSNATLEHVGDVDGLVTELARITAEDGIGVHMVDFRDHSNQDRPLDYLTIPEDTYERMFEQSKGGRGNRVRPNELVHQFLAAGLVTERFDPHLLADTDYVEAIRPDVQPRWALLPTEELRVVGARLFVRKLTTGTSDTTPSTLPGLFTHDAGFCWMARVDRFSHLSDTPDRLTSPLVLYEDGVALGPAHVLHAEIRDGGEGRYSHWGPSLYFSTSDNSDPTGNGRRYTIAVSRSDRRRDA